MSKPKYLLIIVVIGLLTAFLGRREIFRMIVMKERYSVEERIDQYGEEVRQRIIPSFQAASIQYPPISLTMVGFKHERRLVLYARDASGAMKEIRSYPITAASGRTGPKLREGDYQVPEGFYRIESLNPNSAFHLSLRVNYPNSDDKERARGDGRGELGGDIMIHGGAASVGCIAVGDRAAEELFVLAYDVGLANIELIIVPMDLRERQMAREQLHDLPEWVPSLYDSLAKRLWDLPGLER